MKNRRTYEYHAHIYDYKGVPQYFKASRVCTERQNLTEQYAMPTDHRPITSSDYSTNDAFLNPPRSYHFQTISLVLNQLTVAALYLRELQ